MILISWRKPFCAVFVTNSSAKKLKFLAKTFFFVFAINSAIKRPEVLAKTFLFWSAGMVAARWNLVRTEGGPQAQNVADPCAT